MLESLYRIGFRLTDAHLVDEARHALMRRVYEGAEARLTGGYADGSRPDGLQSEESVSISPVPGMAKPPYPKPPR